jgi:acetyltransferase-like isoleucine patch superfamily enzyme
VQLYRRSFLLFVRWFQPSVLVPIPVRKFLLRRVGMQIGAGVPVKAGLKFLHGNVTLGDHSGISDNCFLEDHAHITIGPGSGIGAGTMLITSTHGWGESDQRHGEWRCAPIVLEEGVWVGAGATVLPGVRIGAGCMIAAGSVVTRDCEPNGLYAGVPAVRKRDLD